MVEENKNQDGKVKEIVETGKENESLEKKVEEKKESIEENIMKKSEAEGVGDQGKNKDTSDKVEGKKDDTEDKDTGDKTDTEDKDPQSSKLPKTGEEVSGEKKEDVKPEKKVKKEEKKIPKKEEAVTCGRNLHMSKKQAVYICSYIKNKNIDEAIRSLEEVILQKRAVPFKGEIPHRKGKGMMSGRYPIKASKIFITVLKSLKGNSVVNGLDLDKIRIYFASATWAERPLRGGGRQAKRTNVILKGKEILGGKK